MVNKLILQLHCGRALTYYICSMAHVILLGCGVEREQPTTISGPRTSWGEIQAEVVAECARCHNGVKHPLELNLEANFNKPKVKLRIENGSMPPDRTLAAEVKSKLLSYF